MKRDGHKVSIWQDGIELPPAEKDKTLCYDVLIIGAGMTGLSTGLRLQREGMNSLIVDAHHMAFGTSGGTSAHLNTVLDTPYTDIIQMHGLEQARLVAQSAGQAILDIEQNVATYAIDCDLRRCAGYMYAQNEEEAQEMLQIKDAIGQVDIPVADARDVPVPFDVQQAIVFDGQGSFHPTKYMMGMRKAFLELGGQLVEGTLVQQVNTGADDKLEVKAENGQLWLANKVIYATHTPPGVQWMNFRLAPYRSYIQVYELQDPADCPDALVYDMEEPFHYLRTVWQDGQPLLMVGGQDHKTAHDANERYNFSELEAFVKARYRVKKKRYEWSSQYYESQDGLPFIGFCTSRTHKNELLATGFGGNGMIFSTLSARILTDLIIRGRSTYEKLYSPSRVGPLSAVRDLLVENLDVVKNFVKGRLRAESISELAELGRGEAKVIRYEGDKIGVYKDENGKLYGVDPVCRHAACIVKWNNAENSWDCPCHGARYDCEGRLLNGPALAPLKRWEWEQDDKDL